MLPNYGLAPFMVSLQERTAAEILGNIFEHETHYWGVDENYTKIKDEKFHTENSVYACDDGNYLKFAPENLIPRLNSNPESSKFLCIDFDFINPATNHLIMKYGDAFGALADGIESHFERFFDKEMKISESGVYFAMTLKPRNESSYVTRSVIIPTSKETIEIFPNMYSYGAYNFVNFCDEAENVLHKKLKKIMKNMIFRLELGDNVFIDLVTHEMLPDVEDRTLYPMSRFV